MKKTNMHLYEIRYANTKVKIDLFIICYHYNVTIWTINVTLVTHTPKIPSHTHSGPFPAMMSVFLVRDCLSLHTGHSTRHCEHLWLQHCGLVMSHTPHKRTQFVTSGLSVAEVSRCGGGATWRHVSGLAALR